MKPLVDLDTQLATMDADERLGLHDLPRLTSQQKVYVAARVAGLTVQSPSQSGCLAPSDIGAPCDRRLEFIAFFRVLFA